MGDDMKKVKFRVRYEASKKPVCCYQNSINMTPDTGELYVGSMNVTDSYIIEQYTGLKDKNDVEIYEGDIVKSTFKDGEARMTIVQYDICNPCFVLAYLDLEWSPEYDFIQCGLRVNEVIGNIHENPELLESKS